MMIAGQGATLSIWTPDLLKNLAAGRQVTIFDNRGIGLSTDTTTEPYSIGLYAASTVDLIEALGLEQPDILGWSLGGLIAQSIAVENGDAVSHVVLTDTTSAGQGFATSPASYQIDYSYVLPLVQNGSTIPVNFIFPDTNVGNAALCRFAAFEEVMPAEMATTDQNLRQAPAILQLINPNFNDIYNLLPNITNPLFIIAGEQDIVLAIQNDLNIYNAVPGAEFLQFKDSGHATVLQHGLNTAAAVAAFLDDPL